MFCGELGAAPEDIFDLERHAGYASGRIQLSGCRRKPGRSQDQIAVQVEQTYNKLQRTKNMVEVAQETVKLRTEGERLASNQLQQGVVLVSDRRRANAEVYKAQAELLQANLAYVLARAELDRTIGVVSQF